MTEESVTQKMESGMVDAVQAGIEKVMAAASVNAVFGKPIRQGETVIIPTAEVLTFSGFGMGEGSGTSPVRSAEPAAGEPEAPAQEASPETKLASGSGSGGGGGGQTYARPVAVIVASAEGVQVKPVVDMTKIGLAALTTFGFMLATLARLRRGR